MSISPFSARPASPENESRRTRLALAIALVGIGATLLAYAISPGVRHAVGHAAHSVKHAVSHVLDRDNGSSHHKPRKHSLRLVQPLHPKPSKPAGRAVAPKQAAPAGVALPSG
ncbi:MAG: hypothetical protein ABSG95_01970 [Solirubrobacteraceae bacterium]|jgi:hypothetical protein